MGQNNLIMAREVNGEWEGHPFARDQRFPITSRFGEFPSWRNFPHTGIDMACPEGTRLFAVADGTIRAVYENTTSIGYGLTIDHDAGQLTEHPCASNYYHMRELPQVSVGDKVQRGRWLGYSGNTGFSTGPHLHFGINEMSPESGDRWDFDDPLLYIDYDRSPPAPTFQTLMGGQTVTVLSSTGQAIEKELSHWKKNYLMTIDE